MRRLTSGGKGIMVCVDFSTATYIYWMQYSSTYETKMSKRKRVWSEREYFVVGAWKKRSDLFVYLYSQGKFFSNLSKSRIILKLVVASERRIWLFKIKPFDII